MRAVLSLIVLLAFAVAPVRALDGRRLRLHGGRLVDERRREVTLRGVNARVEGVFDVTFGDGSLPLEPIPVFDDGDAATMARFGLNLLRLRYAARGTAPLELFVPARRFPGGFALRCDGKAVAAPPGPVVTLRCGRGPGERLVELTPAS